MSRYESPGQIVLLFAGASLVSVALIFLLSAEARNRKSNKDTEIVNGNIFTAVGRKMSMLLSGWRREEPDNTTSREHHTNDLNILVRTKRTLMAFQGNENETHPIRHAKHRTTKVGTRSHQRHRNSTAVQDAVVENNNVSVGNTAMWPADSDSNWTTTSSPGDVKQLGESPVKRRLEMCYGTNEVLLIIGITCGVNFAFIFVVMTFVHFCNRKKKTPGDEALALVDSECASPVGRKLSLVDQVKGHSSLSSVQEYVNSLPVDPTDVTAKSDPLVSIHCVGSKSLENNGRFARLPPAFSMENLHILE